MSIFLITALAVYTLVHLIAWLAARPALPYGVLNTWLFLAPLIITLPAVHLLERFGLEFPARIWAMIGYSWMGFIFILFALSVAFFACETILFVSSKVVKELHGATIYTPKVAGGLLALALLAALYGLFEARFLRTEHIVLKTPKLPAGVERIRVAQISDVHLGLILRAGFLDKVAGVIKENQPDILLATGDVVDAQINHLDGLSEIFATLNPPLGKYAVLGNHEVYAGLENSLDFLQKSGFRLLRNESAEAGGVLNIAGVDDGTRLGDETALSGIKEGLYTIFLKHRPVVDQKAARLFDLQLSGHSHRGQIFPFNFLTALQFPMQSGFYDLGEGACLYTSRGTGTWGPPMRVFSPPEVTIIDIVRVN